MSEVITPDSLKNNVLTTEYFLMSDDWSIKQLDDYAKYCNDCLKCDNCITRENKVLFLKYYKKLRACKK